MDVTDGLFTVEELGDAVIVCDPRGLTVRVVERENGPQLLLSDGVSEIRLEVGATGSLEQALLGAQRLMTESKRFVQAISTAITNRLPR